MDEDFSADPAPDHTGGNWMGSGLDEDLDAAP
jgi:hypothetical protein